jgi:hypothetical protein
MKLLIIFGPPAAGKITVGKLVEEQTNFKLFHNHAIMDGVMHIFGKGTPAEDRLSRIIREHVIQEAADAGIDLIFTYVWNFSLEKGKQNIDRYRKVYEERGGSVYFVELTASLAARTQRAAAPDRFQEKAYTADAKEVADMEKRQSFQSPSPFFYINHYLRIDGSDKTPQEITSEITGWLG